jgi:hypothetical protein
LDRAGTGSATRRSGGGMLKTIVATAVAMLLVACGHETYLCAPCAEPASFAVIVFSEVPTVPLRADVCVAGDSCYRLRAVPREDLRAVPCSANVPPRAAELLEKCAAQRTIDGTWRISLRLPGAIDGKTVTVSSVSPDSHLLGQAVAKVGPTDHGTCTCPPSTVASINVE